MSILSFEMCKMLDKSYAHDRLLKHAYDMLYDLDKYGRINWALANQNLNMHLVELFFVMFGYHKLF